MEENALLFRIEQLEKEVNQLKITTADTKEWQAQYGEKINNIEKSVDKVTKMIEEIAQKPQKRWDTLIAACIAAVVTIVFNIFTGKL